LYAKYHGPYLVRAGLTPIAADSHVATKGDIVTIQSYSPKDPAGLIAMYNGVQWVSDLRKHDIWADPGYRIHRPSMQVYRM